MNFETAHDEKTRTVPKAQAQAPTRPPAPAAAPRNPGAAPARPSAEAPPRHGLWWLWLVGIVALAVAGYFIYSHVHAGKAAAGGAAPGAAGGTGGRGPAGPVPVVAVPAREGELKIYLNGIGTVTPVNTVAVHTRVDGQLVQVAYKQGQIVHHDPDYNPSSVADLDKGSQDKSDLLVEVDPRPYQVQLEQAKGQLARDQAQVANAQLDLQRFAKLFAQNSATEQQLQTQQALVAQYTATLQVDQAAIHSAELQLDYCHVRTPIDGRVGLRTVDVGNIVHATDAQPVAVVTQLQPITVEFTLPQDDIPRVTRSASEAKGLQVLAMNRDMKQTLAAGTLEAIDNQVDPGSGTILLRAVFDNKDNALYPRQFVNARLLVETLRNVIIVPAAAVQRSPSSTFVYVVKPDETVAMQDVKVGPTEGDETAIESGLTPGQVVVTDGVDKLVPGKQVSVRPPANPGHRKGAGTQPGAGPASGPATGPATRSAGEEGGPLPEPTTSPATGPSVERAAGAAHGAGGGHRRGGG